MHQEALLARRLGVASERPLRLPDRWTGVRPTRQVDRHGRRSLALRPAQRDDSDTIPHLVPRCDFCFDVTLPIGDQFAKSGLGASGIGHHDLHVFTNPKPCALHTNPRARGHRRWRELHDSGRLLAGAKRWRRDARQAGHQHQRKVRQRSSKQRQPLMAPAVMPSIRNRCKKTNTSTMGIVMITPSARIPP